MEFRVQRGLGSKVKGSGFKFRVGASVLRALVSEFKVSSSSLRVKRPRPPQALLRRLLQRPQGVSLGKV